MAIRTSFAAALVALSLSFPALARSQSLPAPATPLAPSTSTPATAAPAAPVTSAQLAEWMGELESIEGKLEALEQRALADPVMQHAQEDVGALILATMIRIDPSVEARLQRMQAILAEAQAPGIDAARLQELAAEVETIHPRVARVQAQAMEDAEVSRRVLAYKDNLDKHITMIDPSAAQMIARRVELKKMIAKAGE